MKKLMMSAVAVTAIVGSYNSVSAADGINVFDNVKFSGEIRPRYENADVKDNDIDAGQAFTARTKIKVTAGLMGVEGLSATVGGISVNNFGWTDYNDKYVNGNEYDVIVDPQYAMISEASLDYTTGATAIHVGRGLVNLDNQRFIGTVGWRQLERSYDSVYVANSSVKNLSLLAAWVYGFQGVKAGPTADTNTVLLHAAYTVMPELKVTAYGYLIGAKGPIADASCDTYGVALTGNVDVGAKLSYRAEFATQGDNSLKISDVERDVSASYMNFDVGANISGILLGANYEYMSGDDDNDGTRETFITPLGTNHKFNGWADKFLATPRGGLIDVNVRAGYKAKGLGKFLAVYHVFTADKKMGGEDDLGTEIDALYANKLPGVNNVKFLAKAAFFQEGEVAGYNSDVTKFWVMLDYKFGN